MSGFTVYLITRVDALKSAFVRCEMLATAGTVISGMFLVLCWIGLILDGTDAKLPKVCRLLRRLMAGSAACMAVCWLLESAIPTQRELLCIIGVPAALKSRVVQKDIPVVYEKLLNKLLDDLGVDRKEADK